MNDLQTAHRPRHLPRLDSIRGLAMVMVFVYHLVGSAYPFRQDQLLWGGMFRDIHTAPGRSFLLFYPATFGWVGVCLFFVLSGFVIHYSTLTSSRPYSNSNFFRRRFLRIYPAYLLALIVFSGLKFATMKFVFTKAFALDVGIHLVLLQNLVPSSFFGINGAFWSIATEVQFYAIYPLLLLLRRRIGMSNVLWVALALSLVSTTVIGLKSHAISPEPVTWIGSLPMVTWLDWVIGAAVAEKFCRGERLINLNTMLLAGLAIVAIASTLVKPSSPFSFLLMSVLCAGLLERSVWDTRPLHGLERWLVRPGLCSYSFYLWHVPPLLALAAVAKHFQIAPLPYVLLAGPVIYLGLYALSWRLYLLVEKPIEKRKRQPIAPPVDDTYRQKNAVDLVPTIIEMTNNENSARQLAPMEGGDTSHHQALETKP